MHGFIPGKASSSSSSLSLLRLGHSHFPSRAGCGTAQSQFTSLVEEGGKIKIKSQFPAGLASPSGPRWGLNSCWSWHKAIRAGKKRNLYCFGVLSHEVRSCALRAQPQTSALCKPAGKGAARDHGTRANPGLLFHPIPTFRTRRKIVENELPN